MRRLLPSAIHDPRSTIFLFAFIRGSIIFLKESALRGRIALPVIEKVSRKMRDTAVETLALPYENAAASCSSPNNQSQITNNSYPHPSKNRSRLVAGGFGVGLGDFFHGSGEGGDLGFGGAGFAIALGEDGIECGALEADA